MSINRIFLFLAVCLSFAITASAQVTEKPLTKAALKEIVAKKAESGVRFVVLGPNDLAGYSLTALFGGACNTAAPIAFGQTINGSLTSSDCRLDDNSYADFYAFTGTQGQQVTINLSSTVFDTYLGLANEAGTFIREDDDGGGGTNSRIIANLPASGTYIILANALFPNTFGNYSLSLTETTPCTFSINPASVEVPANGGTFSFALTTQPGCYWGAAAQDSYITVINTYGQGSATISYSIGANTAGTTRYSTIGVAGRVFAITQPSINCTYSITPTTANVPAAGGTFEVMMNTPQGCPWIARYQDYWLWTTNDVRYGPGPLTYTVQTNNAGDRTGTITVEGNTLTVHQPGQNCNYAVTPARFDLTAAGIRDGRITVDTQPGCTWVISGGSNYTYFPLGSGGTGPGTKSFIAWPNYQFPGREWTLQLNGVGTINIPFTQRGRPYRTKFDYDDDARADISVFRPSTGIWYIRGSQYGNRVLAWGIAGDKLVPADFDGDRRTDIAVFRPSDGIWYTYNSGSGTFSTAAWGEEGDVPVTADYDGDGKSDMAVYRPSEGMWYVKYSGDASMGAFHWGIAGDKPLVGDFDGDGKADQTVYRPSDGTWYLLRSSAGFTAMTWGYETDTLVPADYDGDGKTDIAVFRPSSGTWYIVNSGDGQFIQNTWGVPGDFPVPADYDGDGMADVGVYRPSEGMWYILNSTFGFSSSYFGEPGDIPTPASGN